MKQAVFPITSCNTNITKSDEPGSYVYTLSQPIFGIKESRFALQSLEYRNTVFNISTALGNNVINLSFPGSTTPTLTSLQLANGTYNVQSLNSAFVAAQIVAGLYLTSTDSVTALSTSTTFCCLQYNATSNKCTISSNPVPSSVGVSGNITTTNPQSLYLSGLTPSVSFPVAANGGCLGLNLGSAASTYYPTSAVSTRYQYQAANNISWPQQTVDVTLDCVGVDIQTLALGSTSAGNSLKTFLLPVPDYSLSHAIYSTQPFNLVWRAGSLQAGQLRQIVLRFKDQQNNNLLMQGGSFVGEVLMEWE